MHAHSARPHTHIRTHARTHAHTVSSMLRGFENKKPQAQNPTETVYYRKRTDKIRKETEAERNEKPKHTVI